MGRHPRWARRLFRNEDFDAIARAIASAEAHTSAEIRVHLERRVPRGPDGAPGNVLKRARHVFAHLGMHRTRERHGVLIYLAVEDRRFAIVGDEGIHARVGEAYWASVRDLLAERLRSQKPADAILATIAELVGALQEHFPRRPDDRNELGDPVSVE